MRDWLAINASKITILDKSRVVQPDPVSYAFRATKVQIESIMEECEAYYKQPGKMLMWISGKGGSYRDKIATVRPYKGNRDPTHKPFHYDAIRDYLRSQYGSYITHGIEADDAVSIFARNIYETGGESLVICTIDKDLDQIPGNHYNYMNKVFYAITKTEADRFFIYQILAGDITDNVVGCWKCGDSAARKFVYQLDAEHELDSKSASSGNAAGATDALRSVAVRSATVDTGAGNNSKYIYGWWPAIVRAYADSQHKSGCPYAEADAEAVAIEQAQLVKLQEYPGQLWHPHGDLVVEGFGDEDFDSYEKSSTGDFDGPA